MSAVAEGRGDAPRRPDGRAPALVAPVDGPPPREGAPDVLGADGALSQKALTIGAVVKQLEREFPDVSISKIRYLEDQKLVAPRRTRGGYRTYSPRDVTRLRTILRLQRDEFLPLRVIRQELAAGRSEPEVAEQGGAEPRAPRRTLNVQGGPATYALADVLEDTGAELGLVRELEEFGVIKGDRRDGAVFYDDGEREIVRAAAELARFGIGARNLRVFRSSADREAALLEQVLAPALRSRSPERRREGIEALEHLAATASHLEYLLLIRHLRRLIP